MTRINSLVAQRPNNSSISSMVSNPPNVTGIVTHSYSGKTRKKLEKRGVTMVTTLDKVAVERVRIGLFAGHHGSSLGARYVGVSGKDPSFSRYVREMKKWRRSNRDPSQRPDTVGVVDLRRMIKSKPLSGRRIFAFGGCNVTNWQGMKGFSKMLDGAIVIGAAMAVPIADSSNSVSAKTASIGGAFRNYLQSLQQNKSGKIAIDTKSIKGIQKLLKGFLRYVEKEFQGTAGIAVYDTNSGTRYYWTGKKWISADHSKFVPQGRKKMAPVLPKL